MKPSPADPFARAAASITGNSVRTKVIPSIRAAAVAVRDAEGDEAKAVAQSQLIEHLAKYFDEDLARREEELKQIEQRLVKLRALLDRRRTSKQEIIELQTKVALNEAEGLGFYEAERVNDPNTLKAIGLIRDGNAPMLSPGPASDDVRF